MSPTVQFTFSAVDLNVKIEKINRHSVSVQATVVDKFGVPVENTRSVVVGEGDSVTFDYLYRLISMEKPWR